MEDYTSKRICEIMDEYSQLKQLDYYDLTLEGIGDSGDVKVTLKKQGITFEKTIKPDDSLDFVSDTFFYPDTITPNSKDISLNGLKRAYFNEFGRLITERDDSTESFKVQSRHKGRVVENLRNKLGKLFIA
jgi:hypothetical protein